MTTTHKSIHQIIVTFTLVLLLLPLTAKANDDHAATVSPAIALEKLLAGNARFMKGLTVEKHYLTDRPELAKAQHPYAIILTCADSRLSPEAIFDESLGQLFVVRVAGNVSDPIILGSIEYATEHLHASLIVVMGHESCGAVKAAVANSPVPPNIAKIVQRLHPAVDKARVYARSEGELVTAAIKENVRYQVKMMTFESDVLSEMAHKNQLKIVGGVYNLHTGQVEFLSEGEGEEAPLAKTETHATPAKTVVKSPAPRPSAVPVMKSSLVPSSAPKKPAVATTPTPAKKASAGMEAPATSRHDDEEETREPTFSAPGPELVAFSELTFANKIRTAYENRFQVVLKRNALLRDSHDRCLTDDCRSLSAGEIVTLDSPHLLEVMGRANLLVRHGRRTFYIPAEEQNFTFTTDVRETKPTLMGQMVAASTKVVNAFSLTSK